MQLVDFKFVCIGKLNEDEVKQVEEHPYSKKSQSYKMYDTKEEKFDLFHILPYINRVNCKGDVQSVFKEDFRYEFSEYDFGELCGVIKRSIKDEYGTDWYLDRYYPVTPEMQCYDVFKALGVNMTCDDNSVICVIMKNVHDIDFVED